jgi:nucleotide-sensitive chloride channel 1A
MPGVALISSLPAFYFQDAVDSTPKSFSDMPVVLKHQENNVRITLEPALEGYQSAVQGTLYILTRLFFFSFSSFRLQLNCGNLFVKSF